MVADLPDININKAIKGATKPKEAPPKDKYIYSIRNYVAKTDKPEISYAHLAQLLVPKLNSLSLIVSLKAHLVFHQLISDVTAPKYIFLSYLSRHYATANRSSVDCTTFDIISDYRNFNRQNALPNLAHSIPQYIDKNRLISAYNRYLRERVLHFRFLKLDPIREKIDGTSLTDTPHRHKLHLPETSGDLLNQIQCSVQQIRLILACIFSQDSLNHPLYSYCYGLVAMDLSIVFRFLNLALVAALQNFFSLPRDCAEKTLFAYKEYTQLQLAEEVHAFIRLGPNAVSQKDLDIPGPLRQDEMAVKQLTKSLEDFLYNPKQTTDSSNSQQARRNFSDSSISQSGSSSTISSSSTNATSHSVAPPTPSKHSSIPTNNNNNTTAPLSPSPSLSKLSINVPTHPQSNILASPLSISSISSSSSSSIHSFNSPPNLEIPKKSNLRDVKSVPNLIAGARKPLSPLQTAPPLPNININQPVSLIPPSSNSNSDSSSNLSNSSSFSNCLAAQSDTQISTSESKNADRLAALQSSVGGPHNNPYKNPQNYEFDSLARPLSNVSSLPNSPSLGKGWSEGDIMVYDLQSIKSNKNNPYPLSKPNNIAFTGSDTTLRQRSMVSSVYDSASSSYSTPNLAQGLRQSQGEQSIYSSRSGNFPDDSSTSKYNQSYQPGGSDSPELSSVSSFGSKQNNLFGPPLQHPNIANPPSAALNSAGTSSKTSLVGTNSHPNIRAYSKFDNPLSSSGLSMPPSSALPLPPTPSSSNTNIQSLRNSATSSLDRGSSLSSVGSGYVSATSTIRSSNSNSSMTSFNSGSSPYHQQQSKYQPKFAPIVSVIEPRESEKMPSNGSRNENTDLTAVAPLSTLSLSNSSSTLSTIHTKKPVPSLMTSSTKSSLSNLQQNHNQTESVTSNVTITISSELSSGPVSPLDPGAKPILVKTVHSNKHNFSAKDNPQYCGSPLSTSFPPVSNKNESTLSQYPEGFDLNDTSPENWQKLFDSLDNSESTFALNFDMAAATKTSSDQDKLAQANGAPGSFLNSSGIPPVPSLSSLTSHKSLSSLLHPSKSLRSNNVTVSKSSSKKFKFIPGMVHRSEKHANNERASLDGSHDAGALPASPAGSTKASKSTKGSKSVRDSPTKPSDMSINGYMTNITPALDSQTAESFFLSSPTQNVPYSDIIKESKSCSNLYGDAADVRHDGGSHYTHFQPSLSDNSIKRKASGLLKTLRKA